MLTNSGLLGGAAVAKARLGCRREGRGGISSRSALHASGWKEKNHNWTERQTTASQLVCVEIFPLVRV